MFTGMFVDDDNIVIVDFFAFNRGIGNQITEMREEMKRSIVIVILVMLFVVSLSSNGLLIKGYQDKKAMKIEVEKAMIMNAYSERTKEWRNFNTFIRQLSEANDDQFPISDEQSRLYRALATPMESVVLQVTSIGEPDYDSFNESMHFLSQFDREYQLIVKRFNSKLPIMTKDELLNLSSELDATYRLYMNEALVNWGIGSPEFSVRFEPHKEKLTEVIKQLKLIREDLEAIE